ncbi:MAG TPA: HIT family protein [Candidatus Acidoferrum sp.]|nr:HIT family protein [Candidatus Acidoferrum sp.]
MSEACTFCRIVRNEEEASRIYEDENVVAFLDDRPVNEGHTLVIPKEHYENIYEIPDEQIAYLFKIVKKVAQAIAEGEEAGGISIVQNNGKAAHQNIFHFHVHIIPRYEGQESRRPREIVSKGELDLVAAKIRKHL